MTIHAVDSKNPCVVLRFDPMDAGEVGSLGIQSYLGIKYSGDTSKRPLPAWKSKK